jgi:hypothetical protein
MSSEEKGKVFQWSLMGEEDIKKLLKNYDEKLNHRLGTALSRVGLYIKREAQLRVPVDTGALKNSARTKVTRRKNLKSEVNISFNTNYAVHVHENIRQAWKGRPRRGINKAQKRRRGTYWDNGGPKYLERAYRENIAEIKRILREAME